MGRDTEICPKLFVQVEVETTLATEALGHHNDLGVAHQHRAQQPRQAALLNQRPALSPSLGTSFTFTMGLKRRGSTLLVQ